ncbi:MAG TPA: precorrin-8X methylmutase [Acidimicrobiales bacterium]|nr:precorrin-8X methylmutase [Acidimicrobiales bacterium]
MSTHPIERESYRILRTRLDLGGWEPGPRAVIERVIHASADLSYADTMVVPSAAVAAGVAAVAGGAPVVVDVGMVGAGITALRTACFLDEAEPDGEMTRSAAAMRLAAERHPDGAVFVVGCAPTALSAIVELATAGLLRPALVIGLPVGFVGAAEAKELLRRSALPAISNTGERGGSAVAAAAFNALVRLAGAAPGAPPT